LGEAPTVYSVPLVLPLPVGAQLPGLSLVWVSSCAVS
jgi:hypothetical protein